MGTIIAYRVFGEQAEETLKAAEKETVTYDRNGSNEFRILIRGRAKNGEVRN
jgi:hypothetical protein